MTMAGSRLFSGVFSRLSGRGAQPRSAAPPSDFALVRQSTHLQDIARVERHLPEILGRALARAWIDADFSDTLRADPKGLLAHYKVFLPTTVSIELETTETQRQRIVVYENRQHGDRRRVMYLQLVMLAGK
jgi:hypothetical protein